MINYDNPVTAALLGVAIGDALGVPVEFKSREQLRKGPIRDMIGYGTYNQPSGTWSDDSSLTFCLAESLCNGYDLIDVAKKLTGWVYGNLWRPHGEIFDIGNQTASALQKVQRLLKYKEYEKVKLFRDTGDEWTNGNGSLMRVLPLLFVMDGLTLDEKFERVWDVSGLTHPHIRSAMACLIYLELAQELLNGKDKWKAYEDVKASVLPYFKKKSISDQEINLFQKAFSFHKMKTLKEDEINSDGYVLHSLEASLWCFLNTNTFEKAVLKAVNLGIDTDTTGAITGGLAGLYYGVKSMPEFWIGSLARLEDIIQLSNKLFERHV